MINKTVETAISEQIKHEFYSAYLYLSMSAWAEANNLSGAAHWLRVQFKEEQGHAMKLYDYIVEQGGRVSLEVLGLPLTWKWWAGEPPPALRTIDAVHDLTTRD